MTVRRGASRPPDRVAGTRAARTSAVWSVASSRVSWLFALFAGVYGLLTIFRGLWPVHRRDEGLLGAQVSVVSGPIGSALTVGLGVVVVLVAHGLARRKRRAWWAGLVALFLLALLDALRLRDLDGLLVSVALLVALGLCRRQFTGRVDATMRGSAGRAAILIGMLGLLAGMVEMALGARHLVGEAGPGARLLTVLRGFVGLSGPVRFGSPIHQAQFSLTMVAFTVLAVSVSGYLLLRAAEPAPHRTGRDEAVVTDLLARYGSRDSLGYFALRQDKSVVVSASGKAALTYRVIAGAAVVSADPLGEPDAWPGAIGEYLALCRRNSWVPAVLGCSAEAALAFERQGLSVLEIGDEAVVDVPTFALQGRTMRNVRQMVNRVRRNGYQAVVRPIDQLAGSELAELESCADAWRVGAVERGYSMALGRLGGPGCVIVVASTIDELGSSTVRAMLQFVPWGTDGWSLDLMRRDPAADPGMNDFMIVAALQQAEQFGIRRVSLNFAMLRQAFAQGERLGAGWAARGWAALLRQLSRWFQLESLYRFNAKFDPTWVPRYLCYPGVAALARVAYAAMEAEAFVQRPALFARLGGRTVVSGDQVVRRPLASPTAAV